MLHAIGLRMQCSAVRNEMLEFESGKLAGARALKNT